MNLTHVFCWKEWCFHFSLHWSVSSSSGCFICVFKTFRGRWTLPSLLKWSNILIKSQFVQFLVKRINNLSQFTCNLNVQMQKECFLRIVITVYIVYVPPKTKIGTNAPYAMAMSHNICVQTNNQIENVFSREEAEYVKDIIWRKNMWALLSVK